MSCGETQRFLAGHIDGELDLNRTLEVDEHLRSCVLCAEIQSEQQALRSAIRKHAPYFRAPAGLEQRVRRAVRRGTQENETKPTPWWTPKLLWAMATAIMILFGTAALLLIARRSQETEVAQEVVSNHVRSLMANHLADVVSTDRHTVKPWFNGRVDFAPSVEDFAAQGFPLTGGRLDYLAQRPVAALVYQRRQHVINVFIWPQSTRMALDARSIRGYNVVDWTSAGMAYWAVSDLNPDELMQFAKLMMNQEK